MRNQSFSRFQSAVITAVLLGLGTTSGLGGSADGKPTAPTVTMNQQASRPPRLTLSPSVVTVKCQPGQSWTRKFHMSNYTPATLRFEIDVRDVIVKDGKRTFTPAGETEDGIAITAVATPREIEIAPQATGEVAVTLTVPARTPVRAAVVYFRSKSAIVSEQGKAGFAASLGSLVTFELSSEYKFEAVTFGSTPQTETSDLSVWHELVNTGGEPVVPKGAGVILDDAGRRAGTLVFKPRCLVPGEKLAFTASNPSQLRPGHYRVISSFEFEGKVVTTNGEVTVQ